MAYTKTNWVNNTTPINETNLNKIEQGIYDNSLVVEAVTNKLNPTDTETYKTAELTEGQITDVIGVSDIVIKGQTLQDGEPTPSAPVDVNVVSGSNIVYTSNGYEPHQGKELPLDLPVENLFDGELELGTFDENGTPISTTKSVRIKNYIQVKPNTTYTISNNFNYQSVIQTYNSSKAFIRSLGNISTFTTDSNTYYIKWRSSLNLNENNLNVKFQLEQGSKANAYTSYGTTPVELCKIGDYQDYFYKSGSKWYLHKEINKITSYNGETITTSYISTTGELSTGAKVYYVVTPTDTKITDTTLISQLEAIYSAPLYEKTNITQTNNDLPMVLDITACKDNINGIKALLSDVNEIKSVVNNNADNLNKLNDVMQNKTVQVSATEPTENDKNKVWFQKTKNLLNCNGFSSYNETNVAVKANYTNNLLNYINVTKSGSTSQNIFILLTTFDFINDTGTYILSGCPSSGGTNTWQLYLRDETSYNDLSPRDEGNGASVTITKGHRYSLYIKLNLNKTFSNLRFFPMLRVSTNTDDTYEPYCQDNMYILNNNVYEKFIPQNEIYSTDEQIVGKWINGKPLYRKVIKTTMAETLSNGTYVNKDVGTGFNIDFGYVAKAILISGTQHMLLPYINNAGYSTKCFIDKNGSHLILANGNSGFNNCETYAIIEYTKATG